MKVCWEQKEEHLAALKRALKTDFGDKVYWLSVVSETGRLRLVVAYHNFCPASCEISVVAFHPNPVDRACLKRIFSYPFHQLGLRRLHAIVKVTNTESLRMTEKLGFQVEGLVRHWYPDCDGIFHGMLKEDCKWL